MGILASGVGNGGSKPYQKARGKIQRYTLKVYPPGATGGYSATADITLKTGVDAGCTLVASPIDPLFPMIKKWNMVFTDAAPGTKLTGRTIAVKVELIIKSTAGNGAVSTDVYTYYVVTTER